MHDPQSHAENVYFSELPRRVDPGLHGHRPTEEVPAEERDEDAAAGAVHQQAGPGAHRGQSSRYDDDENDYDDKDDYDDEENDENDDEENNENDDY